MSRERLKILVALSDKLWDDFETETISEEAYLSKMKLVKREIYGGFINTMEELQQFTYELGYVVIKLPTRTFLGSSDFKIINSN
ncbi:hypothetical protein VUJ46_16395 [Chryseobacterium sp. MYb264]|uniref:hypothetical protein n=1 Tax=Chryseobacterium sp. MYb264 TaxID=2745153 RepID=UPI002E13B56A|nr:hypothetical protein VUJ46_16395 [Chryseobacterium sp. MYb264]